MTKRYHDEHEMIDRYVDLTGRLSGSKAQDLVAMRAARCVLCGLGAPTQVKTRDHHIAGRQKHRMVCSTCGEPWSGRELVVFKGEIDTGRVIGGTAAWMNDRADEHRRLAAIFEARPRSWELRRWRFARLCAFARHDKRIGSYANVAADGARWVPEWGPWWTEGAVRYWVGQFEGKVRQRGERAGLLRRRAA